MRRQQVWRWPHRKPCGKWGGLGAGHHCRGRGDRRESVSRCVTSPKRRPVPQFLREENLAPCGRLPCRGWAEGACRRRTHCAALPDEWKWGAERREGADVREQCPPPV